MSEEKMNPLGSAPVGKLMVKFAIPSIVAMLVGALYNIVDQLFIGHAVELWEMRRQILPSLLRPPAWHWLFCLVSAEPPALI